MILCGSASQIQLTVGLNLTGPNLQITRHYIIQPDPPQAKFTKCLLKRYSPQTSCDIMTEVADWPFNYYSYKLPITTNCDVGKNTDKKSKTTKKDNQQNQTDKGHEDENMAVLAELRMLREYKEYYVNVLKTP